VTSIVMPFVEKINSHINNMVIGCKKEITVEE